MFRVALVAVLTLTVSSSSWAISFFVNDPAGFSAAVAALNVIGSVVAGVLAVVLGSAIARNLS